LMYEYMPRVRTREEEEDRLLEYREANGKHAKKLKKEKEGEAL